MSLIHQVYDTDAHFKIDPVTRAIKNSSTGKNVLIQYDHNSERFTFELPRLVDGHDMSQSTAVEIHYINIDSVDKTKTQTGVYPVTDLQISPEDENVVICSWLISQNATKYAGSLNFLVKFKCMDAAGTVVYRWHTAIFSGISVSAGMDNGEAVVVQYSDVLEQWRQSLIEAAGDAVNSVLFTEQTLTPEQQVQARENIGAIAIEDAIDVLASEDFGGLVRPVNNLYKGKIKDGGYYTTAGEWTESSYYKMAILPVGAVKKGDTLTFSEGYAYYNGAYNFEVFAEDGTHLQSYALSSYAPVTIGLGNAPGFTGDFYVAMRIRAQHDESKLVIVKDGILEPTPYENPLFKSKSPLKGKVFNCLGDSFTAPEFAWHKYLAERTECTCNNYGVASSRVSVTAPQSGTLSFLERYSAMPKEADATIIFGGINDAGSIAATTHGVTLGTMESPLDNTTFYGALKLLITNIKAHMPGKKIIGVIPPDFSPTDTYTHTLPQVQEACREVYQMYGIPYADLKKECQEMWEEADATGYNNTNYRSAQNDNWHPNEKGHKAISEVIQGTLEKYIKV